MSTVDIIGAKGTAELPAELFDAQTNIPLIHQVVVAQLAAARQGTASTKTRSEVAGGGAKPWRQKGTGRARQGSRRAPQWAGGGVVHGPKPRSYAQRTPKKMIAAALAGALSDRAREGHIHVIAQITAGETPSTKAALKALASISGARLLVVLSREEDNAWLSLRNVMSVHLLSIDQLNAYDVLVADDVVFTAKSFAELTGQELEYTLDEAEEVPVADKAEAKEEAKPKRSKKAAEPVADEPEAEAPVVDAAEEPAAEAEEPAAAAEEVAEEPVAEAVEAAAEKDAEAEAAVEAAADAAEITEAEEPEAEAPVAEEKPKRTRKPKAEKEEEAE
jgi:large subunit ribosomal protein L4